MQRSNRHKKRQGMARPDDNLPPDELKKQWEKYLNSQMGHPRHRPSIEVLATPQELELIAQEVPQDYLKMEHSPRMRLFIQALRNCLPKLNLMQQLAVKKYYGIDRESKTQQEIAVELGLSSQRMAARYIEQARKRLNTLIRRELSRLVKASVRQPKPPEPI